MTKKSVIDDIEQYAKLVVEEQYGNDTKDEQKKLLDSLEKVPVTRADLAESVDYLTNIYGTLLKKQAQADSARFALLVRSLEQNRVFSKEVLESLNKQLKAINDEEAK